MHAKHSSRDMAVLVMAGALVWAGAVAGRAQNPPLAPAVVSSDAVQLGAKMEKAAPPGFLKWARAHTREQFDQPNVPASAELTSAVERRWPEAPPEAVRAGAFLLAYLSYQHGADSQMVIAGHIRELGRQIAESEQQSRPVQAPPAKRRNMDPRGVVIEEDRTTQRLEELHSQRKFHRQYLESLQPRVDACLHRLAALYEKVKDVDPAAVRQLK